MFFSKFEGLLSLKKQFSIREGWMHTKNGSLNITEICSGLKREIDYKIKENNIKNGKDRLIWVARYALEDDDADDEMIYGRYSRFFGVFKQCGNEYIDCRSLRFGDVIELREKISISKRQMYELKLRFVVLCTKGELTFRKLYNGEKVQHASNKVKNFKK